MHDYDAFRAVSVILAAFVMVGMVYIGWTLRNARQHGCYCAALFAASSVIGNIQRIEQPPTIGGFVAFAAIIYGLLYIAKVTADHDWRATAQPKGQ
jgi:hypothetical protein